MTLTIYTILVIVVPLGLIFVDLFVELFRERSVKVANSEKPPKYVEIEEDDKDIESYYDGYNFDNWTDPDTEPDPIANCWSYERGNNEWSFEGRHVNAYYQDGEIVDVTFFVVHNNLPVAYSDTVSLPKKVADSIIEDIEMNPTRYHLQGYKDYNDDEVFSLERLDDEGWRYLEVNGDWVLVDSDDVASATRTINF